MSLKASIRNATRQAMKAQRTVRELVAYVSRGDETYDADTDASIPSLKTLPSIPAIFSSYEEKEVDGENVRPMDERATIENRHLIGINPKENDYLTRGGAKAGTWEVVNVKKPTGSALTILHVRRP